MVKFVKKSTVEYIGDMPSGDVLVANEFGVEEVVPKAEWARKYRPDAEQVVQSDLYVLYVPEDLPTEARYTIAQQWVDAGIKSFLLVLPQGYALTPLDLETLRKEYGV